MLRRQDEINFFGGTDELEEFPVERFDGFDVDPDGRVIDSDSDSRAAMGYIEMDVGIIFEERFA